MFACLYLPRRAKPEPLRAEGRGQRAEALVRLARDFSPRIETHGDRVVTLDIGGLGRLLGDARAIGEQLRRNAADSGLRVNIAIASTTTAAILLAQSRAGLTVVPEGAEAATLAPLPLSALSEFDSRLRASGSRPKAQSPEPKVDQLTRWGLRTLGDLAALPSADLSERLGQEGLMWQRWARGEDARPLVATGEEEGFEESIELEWPIDGLEPLSFVFARLFDPLCERLEQRDRGAVALQISLKLVTRDVYARSVQLPAPMRDARVLRTLALLDLETHPPPAAIDRVTVRVDVTEGRVLQFGLFARALPAEKLATLLARLGALMGGDRVGAPALVDSYRPGAFAMTDFAPEPAQLASDSRLRTPGQTRPEAQSPKPGAHPAQIIRRFRRPIPARVTMQQGKPARVTTDRRGFSGGAVERCDGPWRSSGDWWLITPWNCDEWDVRLNDGVAYRISHARNDNTWFIDGFLD
ncbi:MAG: DNA polymerase Y family protein [Vicinamibacterales bacterium]|nr:DNA polymerase Y family protein [Vicinamibacterales bacterium]